MSDVLGRVTAAELATLLQNRDMAQLRKDFGGLKNLLRMLQVHPDEGIRTDSDYDQQQLELRRRIYGINEVPERPPKSYLELLWDALQDATLWMLCGAAVASILIWAVFHNAVSFSFSYEGTAP